MQFYEINPAYHDHPMMVEEGKRTVVYGDYERFYQTCGNTLTERTLLFLFCKNTIGSVFLYLTCLNRGIVPLLLDPHLDQGLIKQLIRLYQPDYLALPEEMTLPVELSDGEHVTIVLKTEGYQVFTCRKEAATQLHPDLALLLTTSGSTGSPKLVRQSRSNINSNAAAIAEYLGLNESERPITTLSMSYTYGLSILNSHFLVGAAVLLTQKTLFEREFWDIFRSGGATSISGVPYTYEMLKRLSFFDMELPSLKTMTQAGGKLSPKLHREFAEYAEQTNRHFVVMYGQTEATARMGYLPPLYALQKCGSMGISIPGGKFRLADENGKTIHQPDTEGELVYEGPNVMMGYAEGAEDLKKGDEQHGILFTGDMAKQDNDGFYYITGRKKRFLKLYGKRINLDEIEQLLKQEYEGLSVACAGCDDHLLVFLENRDETFCRHAGDWLSAKLGLHTSGFQILPIKQIPKNEAGKTQYKELPNA